MKRTVLLIAYVVFLLLLAEGAGQLASRILTGRWPLVAGGGQNADVFQAHPYLVGVPRPGAAVRRGNVGVTINGLGYRGPDVAPLPASGVLRILTLGGSTTFGNYVDGEAVWPARLQSELQALRAPSGFMRVEVINGGVPGYTSAENLIQLSLLGVHLRPHIVVLFQGLNDLRNAHSPGLRPDYANFHAITQRGNLELDRLRFGNRSGLVNLGRATISRLFAPTQPRIVSADRKSGADQTAEEVFAYNLRSFAGICRAHAIQCLFVPQVVTDSFPMDRWWLLYLEPSALRQALDRYNAVMERIANSTGTVFASAVTTSSWDPTDFRDYCHFSIQGHAKFARLLVPLVLQLASASGP